MNIVIAGFGVAGATAAEIAHKQNPKAYITVFNNEKDLFYYRIRLPEIVSGELTPEKIIAHPKSWYDERNIEIRQGESLVEINTKEKVVRGSIGSRQSYDRLLLATGAECNRPSYPGNNLQGIHTVRSLHDAWTLYFDAKGKKKAALIGGGLLGLEMAYALTKLGLEVTVLERDSRVLPRQTTPASAELLSKKLGDMGISFKLCSEADRFEGASRIENVVLKDGSAVAADVLLISAGIVPNLDLAKALDIKCEKAICVDEYMQTSIPDIYAAGDCSQFPGAVGGLWTTSREQALVAGANIAVENPAERKQFVPSPPSNTLKVAGIDLVSAGNIDPCNEFNGIEAQGDGVYRKVVVDADGHLLGFTNLGSTNGNRELLAALNAKKRLSQESLKGLSDLKFDFASL